ncbi:MAG: calcium-binding protein [Rhodovibrio sp.]|nr:calcium-binding protein [Rhodovibrio sp.]
MPDDLIGGTGDDELRGGRGRRRSSRTVAGDDLVVGGDGDDLFVAGPGADLYDVTGGEFGNDTISYRASDAGVAVTLFGINSATAAGGYAEGDTVFTENIVGSPFADDLRWNRGFGSYDSRFDGGRGADRMAAERGDDTYVVDNPGDQVVENSGEGDDTIESSIGYTLPNHVETLELTGSDDIDATGDGDGDTLIGNSGANRLDGQGGSDTLRGREGDDTYIDPAGDTVDEAADQGRDTVRSGASYTLPDHVERLVLTGSGDFDGTGNALANALTGNARANRLDGKGGADTMAGQGGDDTYVVDQAGDSVSEAAGAGTDTVESSVDFTLPANVEVLTVTGSADIDGTGNALDNTLTGNDGANVLDGRAGADSMTGGEGDDTYIVDAAGDSVSEAAGIGEGIDTVRSSVSRSGLATNVENLTLTGTADIDATGNALDNTLTGNVGENRLAGGDGRDRLIGRDGDDDYVISNVFDRIVEHAGGGSDEVETSVSYALDPHVESATLTAAAGGASLTGNALVNQLEGNAGANTLDGGGGADRMRAELGDDTYVVDDPRDTVIESDAGGTDTVQSSVDYTLELHVENVSLTGSADIDGTGNSADNTLTGNGGANRLDGKAGADAMAGQGGDDTYVVDQAGDSVSEAVGAGTDTVVSSLTRTLSAHVERLQLIGTADLDATGNALANRLEGNARANTLDGGGGVDSYAGGLGDDLYLVDASAAQITEVNGAGTDTVESSVDFSLPAAVEQLTLTGSADIDGTGNAGANQLTGNAGANRLAGLCGDDTISYRGGIDTVEGGAGRDTMDLSATGEAVWARLSYGGLFQAWTRDGATGGVDSGDWQEIAAIDGVENLTGSPYDDDLTGDGNANVLRGMAGNDRLAGVGGDDRLVYGGGTDIVDGGGGRDTVDFSATGEAVWARLGYGGFYQAWTRDGATGGVDSGDWQEIASIDGVENLTGSPYDDDLAGDGSTNRIFGVGGDDRIGYVGGTDIIDGGGGRDTVDFSATGEAVWARLGYGGFDQAWTRDGATDGVDSGDWQEIAAIDGVENLTGSPYDDDLAGDGNANVLRGMAGNDQLAGGRRR